MVVMEILFVAALVATCFAFIMAVMLMLGFGVFPDEVLEELEAGTYTVTIDEVHHKPGTDSYRIALSNVVTMDKGAR